MGKERPISSFFNKKRDDEPIVEQPSIPANLLELETRQDEYQADEGEPEPIVFLGIEFLQQDPALRRQI
jgi:hypothetical protein